MMQRTIILRTICIALFLSGSCIADLRAQEWGDAGPGGWLTKPPADYPAANSVVVFDRVTVRTELFRGFTLSNLQTKRHIRFQALTRAGVDEIGTFSLAFHEKTKFAKFEAQTLCPDGSIVPIPKESFFSKQTGDYVVRTFAFPSLDSGCIAEIRYEMAEPYILSHFPWTFSSGYYTLESTFTLELGCQCQYNYRCKNIPAGRCTPREGVVQSAIADEQYPTYSWKLTKLPPIKGEPYMTCVDDYEASLDIYLTGIGRPWEEYTWVQMGKIFDDWVGKYITLPQGFRETINKLTKGCTTNYDKSKAIYQYVVDQFETRQDSYRMRMHHKNLNGLWSERFGTAAEKNLLLMEMLRKARIDCWPVVICTRDHARFDPTWKQFDQFSHLIVFAEVEQGGIYLDASSKYCVYGTLPPVCRVDAGLLIDGLNSQLIKVVTNDPTSYRLDQTTIRLDSDGNASCTTSCSITGYLAAEYGRRYERAAPEKFIVEEALPGLPVMSRTPVSSCSMDSLGRFSVQAEYSIPAYAQVAGSALVAPAAGFMFGENPFKSEYRFTAVDFNYAFTYHNIVTLVADDTTKVVQPPKDLAFNIDGVTFARQSTSELNSARVETVIKVSRPIFETTEYPLVREMFRRVAEATADPLTWQLKGN